MESLVEIGQIVERTDLAHHVLPIVRNMARDNNEEEHRVQAAQLINELAPSLEAPLLDEFVVQHVQLLTGDPMFRVRKAVASNLGNVCTSLGIDKTSEFIVSSSRDTSVNVVLWSIFSFLCSRSSPATRSGVCAKRAPRAW